MLFYNLELKISVLCPGFHVSKYLFDCWDSLPLHGYTMTFVTNALPLGLCHHTQHSVPTESLFILLVEFLM